MKDLTPQEVMKKYVEICAILRETRLSNDFRKGNREGKNILKIFKQLESNIELARQTLPHLFFDENAVTRINAAAHCIALNICVEQAERVLQEIAENEFLYGGAAFEAEMTLKVWHEQGYLKMYSEQEKHDITKLE